jgi:hypothetical protein
MIFVVVRPNVCGEVMLAESGTFTYLFGGGEDILRPLSEGLRSPTDILLASILCILPVATLSLLITSSAVAVLN